MCRMYYKSSSFLLIIILLSSCSILNQHDQQIESTPTHGTIETVSPVPTVYFGPTLTPNPTESALYFSSDQITDGKLRLTIQEVEPVCHNWKDRIQIRFTFKNLTAKRIDIIGVPESGRGKMLYSVLTRSDSNIFHCPNCISLADSFSGPGTPPVIIESLFPFGVIKKVIQYQMVWYYKEISQGNYLPTMPEPGVYFLKFVYRNERKPSSDVWTGTIASNQIQICIAE